MVRFTTILLLFLAFSQGSLGQTNNFFGSATSFPNSSQHIFQQQQFNPAYAGHWSQPNIYVSKNFWKEGNNQLQNYNAHLSIDLEQIQSGTGLIFSYFNPKDIYQSKLYIIGLQHNYRFEFGEESVLRLGLTGALLHFNQGSSNCLSCAVVEELDERKLKLKLDMGVLFEWKGLLLGAAVLNTNEPEFSFYVTQSTVGDNTFSPSTRFSRTTSITAAYDIKIKDKWEVTPSVMMNQSNQSNFFRFNNTYFDFSILARYNQQAFLEWSYKINDPLYWGSVMAAYRLLDKYQLTLSYDFIKKAYKDSNNYRFEIGLAFFLTDYNEDEEEGEDL